MFQEFWKETSYIQGHLYQEEGELLYNLAKRVKGNGVIVEIGSWEGRSTTCLARGSMDGSQASVIAIDPHTGLLETAEVSKPQGTFAVFNENLERTGLTDIVQPIQDLSTNVASDFTRLVELIFIDGNHSYDAVRRDFLDWYPYVIEGGIMVFHDATFNSHPGPKRLVGDEIYRSGRFRNTGFVVSANFGEKSSHSSLYDRIRNYQILLARDIIGIGAYRNLPPSWKAWGRRLVRA